MKSHVPAQMFMRLLGLAALGGTVLLTGCTGAATTNQPDAVVATSQAPGSEFDLDAFCDAVQPLIVPVPREYVGSAEHVADFDAVIEVAPNDLVEDITTLRDHFEFDVHVSDPESQNFENFSQEVQEVALVVDGAFRQMCGES